MNRIDPVAQYTCKNADMANADSTIHFGEGVIYYVDGGSPGFGVAADSADGGPLYSGVVTDSEISEYSLTGVADPSSQVIYETLLEGCASGEEYAGLTHFGCLVTNTPLATSPRLDAFIAGPSGFASAAIDSVDGGVDNAISVVWSSAGLTLTPVPGQSNSNIAGTSMTGAGLQEIPASGLTGVFVDRSTAGRFLVTGEWMENNVDQGPGYAALSQVNGGWQLSPFSPLPDPATAACLGLFAAGSGCFTPVGCPATNN